jgi:hypothetical protein
MPHVIGLIMTLVLAILLAPLALSAPRPGRVMWNGYLSPFSPSGLDLGVFLRVLCGFGWMGGNVFACFPSSRGEISLSRPHRSCILPAVSRGWHARSRQDSAQRLHHGDCLCNRCAPFLAS